MGRAAMAGNGASGDGTRDEGRAEMGELWPVPDVLAYLAGRWRTERSVRDLASGDEGRFDGTTVFDAVTDGGLLSRESGAFTWRGVTRPAERTLRFEPGSAPGTADVRFADGRPFHGLDLSSGHHAADHPCAADLYRGEFTVRDRDHWRTVWRVRGPAKDLLLTTDYARERPGAPDGGPARPQPGRSAGSIGPRGR